MYHQKMYLCSIKLTDMETWLDINPFLLIAIVFGVLVLLVIIVGNLPIKIKPDEKPPRHRSSSSGRSWWKDTDHPYWPDSLKRANGMKY